MSARFRLISVIIVCLQVTQISLWAHHASAAQFDISKTVTLIGVVSRLDWENPHAHIYLDVKQDSGGTESWDIELGAPGAIIVAGLSRDLLQPGTTLTVKGYPGKATGETSARPSACATQVTLANGVTATFVVGI